MIEPTITCPACHTEIKLTESLAAPLIADIRRRYDEQIIQKEKQVANRESAIRKQQAEIAKAKQSINAEVAAKLDEERGRITVEEAQKARRLVAIDFERKTKEFAELNEVLKQRD